MGDPTVLWRLGYITLTIAVDWQPVSSVQGPTLVAEDGSGDQGAGASPAEAGGSQGGHGGAATTPTPNPPGLSPPAGDPRRGPPMQQHRTTAPGCPPRRPGQPGQTTRMNAETVHMRVGMATALTPQTPTSGWVVPALPVTRQPVEVQYPVPQQTQGRGSAASSHGQEMQEEAEVEQHQPLRPRPPPYPPSHGPGHDDDQEDDECVQPRRKRKGK